MDYNALPNSCTFGKAQQEIELSSGLSNFHSFGYNFTKLKKSRIKLGDDAFLSQSLALYIDVEDAKSSYVLQVLILTLGDTGCSLLVFGILT